MYHIAFSKITWCLAIYSCCVKPPESVYLIALIRAVKIALKVCKQGFYNIGFLANRVGSYPGFDQWERSFKLVCVFFDNTLSLKTLPCFLTQVDSLSSPCLYPGHRLFCSFCIPITPEKNTALNE